MTYTLGTAVFVINQNGELYGWGSYNYGEMGLGASGVKYTPTKIGTKTWKYITTDGQNTFAIDSNENLYGTGYNYGYNLGIPNNYAQKNAFTEIPTLKNKKIKRIDCSINMSYAIDENGDIWSTAGVGNSYAHFNNHLTAYSDGSKGFERVYTPDLKWKCFGTNGYVQAGSSFYGISSDGYLYYYTAVNSTTPNVMKKLEGVENVKFKDLQFGNGHILALSEDGDVYTFNNTITNSAVNNTYGQLGDGKTTKRSTPLKVNGLPKIKSISANSNSSAVISEDGELYVWGASAGNGASLGVKLTTAFTTTPVKVTTPSVEWSEICVATGGARTSVAIDVDGNVYTTGEDNAFFGLGAGSTGKLYQNFTKINFVGTPAFQVLNTPMKKIYINKYILIYEGIAYSLSNGVLYKLPNDSEETIINYGMSLNRETSLDSKINSIVNVSLSNGTYSEKSESVSFNNYYEAVSGVTSVKTLIDSGKNYDLQLDIEPFSVYDHISENPEISIYNYSKDDLLVTTATEPFSVYDYISEQPQVVVYTESTDDITVSTKTEPYDLYDEFGDEIEVLFYTDDEATTKADLVLEANWSPIDELKGDFEVVTWTDESQESATRVLEMTAIPKPQFIKLVNPKRLYGFLDDVLAVDGSISYRDEIRYLITDSVAKKWYVWDKALKQFKEVNASTHELITKNGMKYGDLDSITQLDWRTWEGEYMNIGIFLKDNPRDTITSVVDTVSYQDYLPRNTTTVENASFYILNTTAKIDIEFNGNTLSGILSDDDLTRVQYRVLLNGKPYYPVNGEFTKLGQAPQNIELIVGSQEIKIDDWNTIKVEFQDFFGTTDYWSTQFIGTYSGLMFKDVYGQYYSSEIGEVLQYLDFGIIIAGQTTLEHEVILKNQYGYDVKNIHLYANTSAFPNGMKVEFSPTQTPFSPQPDLRLNKTLANNEEMSFFLRLKTELGATPNANGSFDIIVKADRVYKE